MEIFDCQAKNVSKCKKRVSLAFFKSFLFLEVMGSLGDTEKSKKLGIIKEDN